ncbi:hybrid sensor histidine kinase/response regulator [Ramlibacter humi]|uniref:histidine kinase n=1 Tax=Ramlibacter humi TaxID=2530451 RepID=A0A4Z0CBA4_9BURK|nr:ATP-binding protein [Ramlibacter humi]TFZ07698.1 response regulator [Ramlibacter humi]
MSPPSSSTDSETGRPAFLRGGGELAGLIARYPWSSTGMGPIDGWPAHVRHTVALMLRSDVPMVALFGEPGYMIYNDAYSGFAGGRHPQLLGSPVREGWPEVADFNDNVMRVGLAGGTLSYKDQELSLNRQGTLEQAWMDLDYSPVLDGEGRPAAVLAIVVETTEKVRALRRLAGERERLHQMFEQAPGFMCVLRGPDHVFEFANAAYRQLFGRELLGYGVREAFPELEGQGFFERLDEVYGTGKPWRAEAMPALLARPGGARELKFLTYVYQPLFDEAGRVDGIFCEGSDATQVMLANAELQRTQSWLQEGLEAARMVAFEWDYASGQVRYSPNAAQVLGYAGGDPETGFSSIHPDDVAKLRDEIGRARETLGDFQRVHRRVRRDTGALMWTDTRGRAFPGPDGRPALMRGVVIDVTDRVRSEQALREANRRKDEFLAMLAHELRNPLAPIATGSALLARAPGNAETARRTSEMIARQVRHMSELMDDLLDVSRVTRGLIQIEHAPVDLNGVVQDALEQARPLMEARHHRVDVDVPPAAVVVDGDRTRLVQVLVNLLTNAAKYTAPEGEVRVTLSREGSRARIEVGDNGTGIEPALLPHVFDLFTQGERTPDRTQGGLGIGLALVKAIVELHGGEAEAHSQGKGRGSRFGIVLPALAVGETSGATAPAAARGAAPLFILLTDDNADAAESLSSLLRLDGHEVEVCYDGRQALAAIGRRVPDVCVLDVGLPDITGLELARRIRARPELDGTLLVALTGYGQPQDRAATAHAGFDHHLVKPVEPQALDAILAAYAATHPREVAAK